MEKAPKKYPSLKEVSLATLTKHHLLLTAPSHQQLCGLPGPGAGQLGHALYQEGRCQWCGCGLRCANLWDFLHHLREEHQVTRVIRDT